MVTEQVFLLVFFSLFIGWYVCIRSAIEWSHRRLDVTDPTDILGVLVNPGGKVNMET
jgi:hypothetical protein